MRCLLARSNLKTDWRHYPQGVTKQSRARPQNSQAIESITDIHPGRTAYSSLLTIFPSSELRPVAQLASLKLGLPTSTQFKDGLIRLWSFPSHPPMPLHSCLGFGLTRRPQADPRLRQELFLCLFGCLIFGLIFLPVTQRDILDWDREGIPCTLLRKYQALL